MPIDKSNPDAEKAAAYAEAAQRGLQYPGEHSTAAANASLAVYYQLRAAESGEQVALLKNLIRAVSGNTSAMQERG